MTNLFFVMKFIFAAIIAGLIFALIVDLQFLLGVAKVTIQELINKPALWKTTVSIISSLVFFSLLYYFFIYRVEKKLSKKKEKELYSILRKYRVRNSFRKYYYRKRRLYLRQRYRF